MGFCTEEELSAFFHAGPPVEKAMVDSGIILLKYWLEVSPEEQTRRLEARLTDGRKLWKLSEMDLKSYARWDDYSRARDEMFEKTHTSWAPWRVARSDDKKRARLNVITDLLEQIPYKSQPPAKIELPKRKSGGYVEGGCIVDAHCGNFLTDLAAVLPVRCKQNHCRFADDLNGGA